YLIFVLSILKLNPAVGPTALENLVFLSRPVQILMGAMGFLNIWTSYFMVGLNLRDILSVDIGYSAGTANLIVFALPLALYFLGFQSFLGVIGLTGGVFLALEGIYI